MGSLWLYSQFQVCFLVSFVGFLVMEIHCTAVPLKGNLFDRLFVCLQHACGYEYTNRLHRMFTDMSISSDLNNSFTDFLSSSKTNLGINFSLLVLTVSDLFKHAFLLVSLSEWTVWLLCSIWCKALLSFHGFVCLFVCLFLLACFQSGAWPLNQTSISPLTIPQLLVNCVLKVLCQ